MRPPILVADLELTEPVRDFRLPARDDGPPFEGVRLLVRMQRSPVGYASIAAGRLDAASVANAVWSQLSAAINTRRERSGLTAVSMLPIEGLPVEAELADEIAGHPVITVVVCTRDRTVSLLATLRTLAEVRYAPVEVLVVDNAPSSDQTLAAFRAGFAADPRFRYVREPRPGLSRARNRGVAEAAGEIIAFTDDDVLVDPWWLEGIVRGFGRADNVACVTGLIRTALLDNVAQLYFDQRETWGASCEQRVFDLADHGDPSPLYPYSAGIFGAGANFAMTRSAMRELGGFDEALGAGTPSGGGEDLEIFVRTVLTGKRLVYEPSAVVSHIHRADLGDLASQMRAYGSGATAALTALLLSNRRARRELPAKVVAGAIRISAIGSRTKDNPILPSGLIKQEYLGMLAGPGLYLRGRRLLRSSGRRLPDSVVEDDGSAP